MKFAMLICGVEGEAEQTEAGGGDSMAAVWEWFKRWEAAGKIAHGGAELAGTAQARTVRLGSDGTPVVTDGPYLELKEVIGGVIFLNAADIGEAVDIAATWPIRGSTSIEVRPTIQH